MGIVLVKFLQRYRPIKFMIIKYRMLVTWPITIVLGLINRSMNTYKFSLPCIQVSTT